MAGEEGKSEFSHLLAKKAYHSLTSRKYCGGDKSLKSPQNFSFLRDKLNAKDAISYRMIARHKIWMRRRKRFKPASNWLVEETWRKEKSETYSQQLNCPRWHVIYHHSNSKEWESRSKHDCFIASLYLFDPVFLATIEYFLETNCLNERISEFQPPLFSLYISSRETHWMEGTVDRVESLELLFVEASHRSVL